MKPKKAKIDLAKFVHVRTAMKGKTGEPVAGVFIPFAANDIYVGEKSLYLDLVFWPSDKIQGFDHAIKQDFGKDFRDKNDVSKSPFIGNALLGDVANAQPPKLDEVAFEVNAADDLPF